MARIRTLKPEFWNSPSTAQADLAVRLTFMAMWNWADDSGHGTANLKELEAFCWPNDEVQDLPRERSGDRAGNSAPVWRNFAEICGEVAELYGVVFYRVAGRPYYEITNFKRHQSKDYREKSRYPLPEEGEIYDVTSGNVIANDTQSPPVSGASGDMRGNSAASTGKPGPGTGEQGNRGTEEQGSSIAHAPATPNERPTGRTVPADGWRLIRDHIPETHPQAVRTALAIQAGTLLKSGTPQPDITAALTLWLDKPHAGPGLLPSLVSEIVKTRNRPTTNTTSKSRRWADIGRNAAHALAQSQQGDHHDPPALTE